MTYRKYRDLRSKVSTRSWVPTDGSTRKSCLDAEDNEIARRIKNGDSPVWIAHEFGYNAVVRACTRAKL